ncbi:SdrD B-like domain-containing protein [Buchananella felis]|uniref:DUF7927 domain-containing protein n=1 Tax=Buchananella felis TaxID=3231492 RepID=UPI0035287B76
MKHSRPPRWQQPAVLLTASALGLVGLVAGVNTVAWAEDAGAGQEQVSPAPTSAPAASDAAAPAEQSEAATAAAPAQSEASADTQAPATEPAAEPAPVATEAAATEATAPAPAQPASPDQLTGGAITGFVVAVGRDGTEGFDTDDAAGNDSGPQNGIVRVNDTVTYDVNVSSGSAAVSNPTFTIVFPKGMEITELPGMCRQEGSSIVPATAGTPTLPLTENSIDQLAQQTLTCNLGSFDPNKSVRYAVTAKVVNLAKQGQSLALVRADMTSDGQDAPVVSPTLPSVTASSVLRWDLSKNGISDAENQGYIYGPAPEPCPWDKERICFVTTYPLLLSAPAGGKGAMPAIGDVTVVDDLSPESFYPSLAPEQIARMNADLEKYGSRVYVSDNTYSIPGSKSGIRVNGVDYTNVNAVRDSGSLNIAQDGPGKPVTFTISAADMTLRTFPSQVARPVGNALPANRAYAISRTFSVYTPAETIRDFGTPNDPNDPTNWTLQSRNAFSEMRVNGFDGATQTIAQQPTFNDHRISTAKISLTGDYGKYFAGAPGAPGNMTPQDYNPSWSSLGEGMPGGSTMGSGTANVARGQEIISVIHMVGAPITYPVGKTFLACDSWDNSVMNLKVKDWPGSQLAPAQFLGSNGAKGVWVSGYNNVANAAGTDAIWTTDSAQVPAIKVQYSAVPGGTGQPSICDDTTGPWFDTPQAVPGNDPEKAAKGVYTGVARVRIHAYLPKPVGNFMRIGNGYSTTVSIGMEIADTDKPNGTIVPNWASVKRVANKNLDQAGLLADTSAGWTLSNYKPGTSITDPNGHVGSIGDRVIISGPQARVSKQVRVVNPDQGATQGEFTKVPPVVSGDPAAKKNVIEYELRPSLISGALTPGQRSDVVLEDCMPSGVNFMSASIAPDSVGASKPDDWASRDCDADETWVRWLLPNQQVNQALAPIIVRAQVSPTAPDGVYRNDVVVLAPGDHSLLKFRTDAADIQINNPAGIFIEKKALTPVLEVNSTDAQHVDLNKWKVTLTNTLPSTNASEVSNVDFIDVLPRKGLAGNNTSHSGTFEFQSARELLGDATVKILYTKATDVSVTVADASNGASGSTAWCDAPANGTKVSGTGECPASAAEVTGLRIQRPGVFPSKGSVQIELSMLARGNVEGDVYQNFAAGRVDGLVLPVGPVNATETVIASALGDFVWDDLNGNGVQDDNEPGVAGVTVTLTGEDDLGNQVNLTTTTDDQGHYSFPALRASGANGYSVKFALSDALKARKYEFTGTNAGQDDAKDSDADGAGVVTGIMVGRNTDVLTIDAGIARPSIQLVKSADKTVVKAGDVVKYTFTATNNGSTTLSQVKLTDTVFTNGNGETITFDAPPVVDAAASTGTVDNMPVGGVIVWTANYTVKAQDLDENTSIDNTAVVTARSPRDTPVTDTDKEKLTPFGSGSYVFSKTSNPASGSKVLLGDTIVYTVTVSHRGELAVKGATLTDNLSAVLDDATYQNDVAASSGTARVTGNNLTWNGDLPVGGTVTITYSVKAKKGGDMALNNVVTTTNPKGSCDDTVGCETNHRIEPGTFVFAKSAQAASGATVKVGDVVTYTVVVEHEKGSAITAATLSDDLSAVLDDATYQNDVAATSGTATVSEGKLNWTGDLAVGAKATITYSVRVGSEGDGQLRNVVTTTHTKGRCKPTEVCETNHQVEPGKFVYSKTADAATGSTVKVGDDVKYTVTVEHTSGTKIKAANIVDDLAAVLDDATYNNDVQASAGTAQIKDGKLNWTGDIPVGAKITITYSVKVGSEGDGQLRNVVTSPTPSGACKPTEVCETNHQVEPGKFVYSKTANPANGTTVKAGEKVVYTLTVRHASGTRIDDARISDDLAKVLDDATYNNDVKASAGDVVVKDGKLAWEGKLAVGAEVTITFSVTVKDGGDLKLFNEVVSDHPKGACDDAVGCKVEHPKKPPVPTPSPTPSKPAKPGKGKLAKTGSAVVATSASALGLAVLGGAFLALRRRRDS